MPGLRIDYQWSDIIGKNKLLAIRPVKQKIKLMLGMLSCYAAQVFVFEPANPFDFIFYQQSGIYGYLQYSIILGQRYWIFGWIASQYS